VEKISTQSLWWGKPKRKGACGRIKRGLNVDFKMDFIGIEWDCVEWMHLAWDTEKWQALEKKLLNFGIPELFVFFLMSTC
jgi:hypothetical protein